MNEIYLTVTSDQIGKRIDSWLAEQIEGLTRSAAQNLLANGAVCCNGHSLKKTINLSVGRQLPSRCLNCAKST